MIPGTESLLKDVASALTAGKVKSSAPIGPKYSEKKLVVRGMSPSVQDLRTYDVSGVAGGSMHISAGPPNIQNVTPN